MPGVRPDYQPRIQLLRLFRYDAQISIGLEGGTFYLVWTLTRLQAQILQKVCLSQTMPAQGLFLRTPVLNEDLIEQKSDGQPPGVRQLIPKRTGIFLWAKKRFTSPTVYSPK